MLNELRYAWRALGRAPAFGLTARARRPPLFERHRGRSIGTMTSTLATAVSAPRFRTVLVGTFAVLALCLALAGVCGVMAYAVGRRIPEIGVRMALGAAPRDILGLVPGQGLKLAVVGIVIGWILAIDTSRLLTQLLFGVGANDPLVFAGVPALLLIMAIVACAAPALRAARTDPMQALREP